MLSRKLKKDVDSERLKEMTLMDYWDGQYRCTWVDGCEGFLCWKNMVCRSSRLSLLPREGSDLFDAPEDQREPFLLTVWLSRMDQRKTEALTAMATRNRINGFSPRLAFTRGDAVQDVPSSEKMGLFTYVDVPPGSKWEERPNITVPGDCGFVSLFDAKTEGATIFKITIGEILK